MLCIEVCHTLTVFLAECKIQASYVLTFFDVKASQNVVSVLQFYSH